MSSGALLVDCLKIINWLEDRKKLRKDWYDYLKAGEEKIKALLKDRDWTINYPALHDHLALNEQTFNFNDLSRTVELLLETDLANQRSLLFGYSDPRVKQWTALKKYLEGNNLNLLNLAKFIDQSLRFDLPGLSKAVEALDAQLATLRRKIDFNNNTIYQQHQGLVKERGLLGVEADPQLPIEELVKVIVGKGPQQIRQFQAMLQQQQLPKYVRIYDLANKLNETDNSLNTLQYFLQHGDQFHQLYQDPSKAEQMAKVNKYSEFDHWKPTNEWEIEVQGESHSDQNSRDYSTVLEHREFRQKLLTDLTQLLYFFKATRHECLTADKGLGFEQEQREGETLALGEVEQAIRQVQNSIDFLTSKQLTAPLELKNSKKAYQVLVSQFLGYEANISAMRTQIRTYQQQIVELQERRQKQVQKLRWLRRKVLLCRPVCENWLSGLVKRQVRVTGEINKLQ